RALVLNPSWEDAAIFKARILVSQKDTTRNQRFHEQYLNSYPRANGMRLGYARLLVDLKQWDKARVQFRRLASDTPKDADVTFTLALLALQMNDTDEGETWLQRTLDLQSDNDQARLHLGQLAEQRKRYDEAARWYGEVDAPEIVFEAQSRIGILLAKQGHVEEARTHLHNLQPANDVQRLQIVLAEEQILREAKRYPDAYDILTTALRRLPNNTDLLYARALLAEKLNRLDSAEKDLRQILKKEPKNSQALNALGYTLADRTTRYTEAQALIEQALAEKPDDPFILDSMGWVQYRLGKHAEALRYLRLALEKRPDAEIAAHLGEVLWVTGDRAGAESVWKSALKQTPDSEALLGVISKFKTK
ncbi:MAG: tetratricopeptide repeat protein, partial [Gammaproteobacteria bacterium]|nr:tetratricopeptide repeat protein [Gammaproteobacteria bacterium]